MALIQDLLEKPSTLSAASKYTVMNGGVYLACGALLIICPGAVQTIFMEPAFSGHEEGLIRMTGARWEETGLSLFPLVHKKAGCDPDDSVVTCLSPSQLKLRTYAGHSA